MARRIDWHELSRRAAAPFLVLVAVSWVMAWHLGAQRPAPDLYPFLKRSWPGASFESQPGGSFRVTRQGQVVGWAVSGSASGYSGPVTMAVGVTPDGAIRSLAILEYRDTPDLMKRSRALLRALVGKLPSDPFEVGNDVDAISGATASSRGIALASLEAARAIAARNLAGLRQSQAVDRPMWRSVLAEFGAPEATLLALLLVAAVGRNRPRLSARTRKLLRTATLLGSLVTLGVLFNRPWVIAFPVQLLAGDWPSWRTHLYWYILLGGVLLAFNRTGKNPYCPWICPFGAAQDLVGLVGGARRRRMPAALFFTWVKRVLLWLAVLLGLLYRNPGAASYEVFPALFRGSGTGFQIAILVFTLLVGVFVSRPFCHWVCPVDTIEQFARWVRTRALRLLGRRPGPSPRRPLVIPLVEQRPAVDPVRRFRNGLITAIGVLCAVLVVGHLYTRFAVQSQGAQENLMGETFVAVDRP